MKTNNLFILMVTLLTVALCFTACEKDEPDPCDNVECQNGGNCDDGSCDCPTGFTGANCETEVQTDACDNIAATYNDAVIEVLSVTCSYDACHGVASTFGRQNFNVYSNIKPFLDNGAFEKRVLQMGDAENPVMPPPYAPDGKPKELTAEQLQILNCWKDAGYPEE